MMLCLDRKNKNKMQITCAMKWWSKVVWNYLSCWTEEWIKSKSTATYYEQYHRNLFFLTNKLSIGQQQNTLKHT